MEDDFETFKKRNTKSSKKRDGKRANTDEEDKRIMAKAEKILNINKGGWAD